MHDSEKEGTHSFIHFLFKDTKFNFKVQVKNVNASVNGQKPTVSNTLPTYWGGGIAHANFMLIGRNMFFITKNFKIPTIQKSEKSCLLRKAEKYEIKFKMSLQWVMKLCSYPPKCSLQI
jgi:hypothetical protein